MNEGEILNMAVVNAPWTRALDPFTLNISVVNADASDLIKEHLSNKNAFQ